MVMAELFISYSSRDRDIALKINERLKAAKITTWIDREIELGADWQTAIERAIRDCRVGLVILSVSSAALDSVVRRELDRLHNLGKPIFAARIDDVPLGSVPLLASGRQHVDLRDQFDTNLDRLITQIVHVLRRPQILLETSEAPRWPVIPSFQHPMVGQEALKAQVEEMLASTASIVALYGPDGIGKTMLAARLAHEWEDSGKRVLWLAVGERAQGWSTLFQDMGVVFQVPYLTLIGKSDQYKKLRMLLIKHAVDLVVLDDVRAGQPVGEFVHNLFLEVSDMPNGEYSEWGEAPRCAVLMTSQTRLDVGQSLEVLPLTPESARQLFRMRAGLPDSTALDAHFDLLENHPLMVEIAASMVRTGKISPGALFDLLGQAAQQHPRHRLMLRVAFDRLDARERRLLEVFGATWATTATAHILTEPARAQDDPDPTILEDLASYSLITRHPQDGPMVEYSIHESGRVFLRQHLAQNEKRLQMLQSRALDAYIAFVDAYSDGSQNPDHFKYLDIERENIVKAAEWAATQKNRRKDVLHIAEKLCWERHHFLNMRGYQPYVRKLLSLVYETMRDDPPDTPKAGELRMRLGRAYNELGDYKEALDHYNAAKQIAENLRDRWMLARVLGNRAQALHNISQFQAALFDFERALRLVAELDKGAPARPEGVPGALVQEDDRKKQRALLLSYMGVTYADMGYYAVAGMCYAEALRLREEVNDPEQSVTLGNIGNMLCDQGHYDEALEHYTRAHNQAQEIDQRRYGRHLGNLGNVDFHKGRYKEAEERLKEALKIHRDVGDRRREARRLGQLANVYRDWSQSAANYEDAASYYQVSLDMAENLGDIHCQIYALNGWGLMQVRMGRPASADHPSDFQLAREKFEKALKMAGDTLNRRGEGNARSNLGTVFIYDPEAGPGGIEKGIEYLLQGLEIAREIGNPRGEVFALIGLGNAYARRMQPGDEAIAIRYYEQALEMARAMDSPRECVYALNGLGRVSLQSGQQSGSPELVIDALKPLGESLAIAQNIQFRMGEASCRCALANAYLELGSEDNARENLEKACEIYTQLGLPHKAQRYQESLRDLGTASGLDADLAL